MSESANPVADEAFSRISAFAESMLEMVDCIEIVVATKNEDGTSMRMAIGKGCIFQRLGVLTHRADGLRKGMLEE